MKASNLNDGAAALLLASKQSLMVSFAFDIDKNVKEIKSNSGNLQSGLIPEGAIQSKTDFGVLGYGGPCPTEGDKAHRYVITVHALKTEKLGLDAATNPALVGFMLGQQTIEKASLILYHKR